MDPSGLVSGSVINKIMMSVKHEDIMTNSWVKGFRINPEFRVLFDLILYVPSTIFQLNRDWSSWVEPVLS